MICTLIQGGFKEKEILAMPMDKFYMYVDSVGRNKARDRKIIVSDTAAAIGIAFSGNKEAMKQYFDSLEGE